MQHGNFETIDLSKALFHVLGFLTVDVSSPFYTIVESVDDRRNPETPRKPKYLHNRHIRC
jgi:hypothetical protein